MSRHDKTYSGENISVLSNCATRVLWIRDFTPPPPPYFYMSVAAI